MVEYRKHSRLRQNARLVQSPPLPYPTHLCSSINLSRNERRCGIPGYLPGLFQRQRSLPRWHPHRLISYGFVNCDQDITILGHSNIIFTGCQQPCTAPYPYCYPTGVSDNGAGAPALTCRNATNPPDAPGIEYGIYASCEPGTNNGGSVIVRKFCS